MTQEIFCIRFYGYYNFFSEDEMVRTYADLSFCYSMDSSLAIV